MRLMFGSRSYARSGASHLQPRRFGKCGRQCCALAAWECLIWRAVASASIRYLRMYGSHVTSCSLTFGNFFLTFYMFSSLWITDSVSRMCHRIMFLDHEEKPPKAQKLKYWTEHWHYIRAVGVEVPITNTDSVWCCCDDRKSHWCLELKFHSHKVGSLNHLSWDD